MIEGHARHLLRAWNKRGEPAFSEAIGGRAKGTDSLACQISLGVWKWSHGPKAIAGFEEAACAAFLIAKAPRRHRGLPSVEGIHEQPLQCAKTGPAFHHCPWVLLLSALAA